MSSDDQSNSLESLAPKTFTNLVSLFKTPPPQGIDLLSVSSADESPVARTEFVLSAAPELKPDKDHDSPRGSIDELAQPEQLPTTSPPRHRSDSIGSAASINSDSLDLRSVSRTMRSTLKFLGNERDNVTVYSDLTYPNEKASSAQACRRKIAKSYAPTNRPRIIQEG